MFIIKLHLKHISKLSLEGGGERVVGEVGGIKGFLLQHKRVSSKLNDIFSWIHGVKLIIFQVFLSVLIESFITSLKNLFQDLLCLPLGKTVRNVMCKC